MMTYDEIAKLIDHALLRPDLTDEEMEAGCLLAAECRVASVCVKPYYVCRAAKVLAGTGVAVGTVVGYPHGGHTTGVKVFETQTACRDGVTEIDVVINIGNALSGDWDYVAREIGAVADAAHSGGALLKVIFEAAYLPEDETKIWLCRICEEEGADFVKTSTGFAPTGATEHDVALMRAACSSWVGVKASGGIRDLDTLLRLQNLGATRIGTSSTRAILDELRERSEN
jgi:deoxyribose-phosphate aldolase